MIRQRSRRGQSLVEFALAMPLLIFLLVGVFDLGRAVYGFNAVSNASHAGARVAIVNQDTGDIETVAVGKAVSIPVSVDVNVPDACVGCLVDVTVTYQYAAATPLIGDLIGPITITSTTTVPIERVCPDPPDLPKAKCWPRSP